MSCPAEKPTVLDPCSGSRSFWFEPNDQRAMFGDLRREAVSVSDRSHGRENGQRVLEIDPDMIMDFRDLPFKNDFFHLVVFDPPHLLRAGAKGWMQAKYGVLSRETWRSDIATGFSECFRVLRPHGVLIFKWAETQIRVSEILPLAPHAPLFGHKSGKRAGTHWITFMKPGAPA